MRLIPTSIDNIYLSSKGYEMKNRYKLFLSEDGKTFIKPPEKVRKEIHSKIHKPENSPQIQLDYCGIGAMGGEYSDFITEVMKSNKIHYDEEQVFTLGNIFAQLTSNGQFIGAGMLPEKNLMRNISIWNMRDKGSSIGYAVLPFIYRAVTEKENRERDTIAAQLLLFDSVDIIDRIEKYEKSPFTEREKEINQEMGENIGKLVDSLVRIEPIKLS